MSVLLISIAVAESVAVGAFIFWRTKLSRKQASSSHEYIKAELALKKDLWERIENLSSEMADPSEFKRANEEVAHSRELLKAERGRVIITQAELESVEVRLRELEEINRELEASTLETKEDLRIFQKREEDLKTKNDELRTEIAHSTSKMEALISQIQMSVQMQEQVKIMRADLLRSEQQVATLMNEIQTGNEQYFVSKRRYDALDVEYAQLFQQHQEQAKK